VRLFRRCLLASAIILALVPTGGLADWTTYHLDNTRTGNDTAEPAATTVTSAWNTTLSGQVYAEPLIVGNTVLIATEQNNVYGLDAASGAVLWSNTSLGAPVPQSSLPCGNINPVGITGTPVVDTSSGLMYVVATLAQPSIHYQLYAIDITNGGIAWQETIAPAGFNAIYQGQRGALALANGRVYIPFGGRYGDCGTYSGWVIAALAGGPGSVLSFSLPNGPAMGGIWASGGSSVDASGNVYVATGNTSCGSNCSPFDYGETVLKLTPTLALADWWTPTDYASLNTYDVDLGSVAPALLPNNLVFQVGKAGTGYLLNAAVLGHISSALFSASACPGLTTDAAFGGTAWAAPYLYVPCRTKLVALNVNTSGPTFTVAWQGPGVSYSGPPILAGGVVWTIDPAGTLYGLDPATGAQRYAIGITSADHFATPAASVGRLFVPAGQVIRAYLLTPSPSVRFNPASLTFGNQPQGTTSPAQNASITNNGTSPLTINAISTSGDFGQTNSCGTLPATFAPGQGCTLSVTFTPTATGTPTGTVDVADNANGSPHQLGLTGNSFAFKGAYTLDGWGGLHADGGSPAMTDSAFWPGWKIARSGALLPDGTGGYVLDGYGGAHTFGSTSAVATAYFGWDIARDIAFLPTATAASSQGYTLDGYGGIHPFGGAPAVQGGPYWRNNDIARRLVVLSDGSGGYVLDGLGGLHPFAVGSSAMPPAIANNAYWPNWAIARGVALAPGSTAASVSGVTLDGWGGVHPFGNSGAVSGATASWPNWDIARAVRYSPDSTASGPKGWVLDGYGGLHAFGGAPSLPAGGYWGWDIATQLILG
jgi:outer membrane protein assembly factor BamB